MPGLDSERREEGGEGDEERTVEVRLQQLEKSETTQKDKNSDRKQLGDMRRLCTRRMRSFQVRRHVTD